MRITLTVIAGPHEGKVYNFSGHDTFLVGRSRRAHFRLPSKDRYFSRIHFLVEVNPPHCGVMDMASRNGTYVNGERVQKARLAHGDQIKAGRSILRVAIDGGDGPDTPAPAPGSTSSLSLSLGSEGVSLVDPGTGSAPPLSFPPPLSPVPLPPPLPAMPIEGTPSAVTGSCCPACDALLSALSSSATGGLAGVCPKCQESIRAVPQTLPGYHIVRELGRGAMGLVYLALRQGDLAAVAVKTIIPAVAASPTQVERFLREAEILRKLDHPHIVSFRDMREAGGVMYFAMDYVRGQDASKVLKRDGPLAIGRAVRLACQLLDALAYAHDQGFVHRDIKPSNLLVSGEGEGEVVRVADFGLARMYQSSHLSGLTMTGDIGGTLAFMPPEQITEYREAKPPADQYSAAATLYTLLTGKYVHDLPDEFQKQILKILHDEPVPIRKRRRDIPQGLSAVIHKALAREPSRRWADVRSMRQALAPWAG